MKTRASRKPEIDVGLYFLSVNAAPDQTFTLQAIADVCGVSRERISQIEKEALVKIKRAFEERGFGKKQCSGRLVKNDMSVGDSEAFVCVWCGATFDASEAAPGQRCTRSYAPPENSNGLFTGDRVGQTSVGARAILCGLREKADGVGGPSAPRKRSRRGESAAPHITNPHQEVQP